MRISGAQAVVVAALATVWLGVLGCSRGGTRLELAAESEVAGTRDEAFRLAQMKARRDLEAGCADRRAPVQTDTVRWVREGDCIEVANPKVGHVCRAVITGQCGNIVDNVRYGVELSGRPAS